MKTQRFVIALTALNLAFLVFAVSAQNAPAVLRASALEIVDERGVVRARLGIKGSDVIELDLFDRQGTIRVKPTADRPATTHITLKAPGGREHVIKP